MIYDLEYKEHEFVLMPNRIHEIIQIVEIQNNDTGKSEGTRYDLSRDRACPVSTADGSSLSDIKEQGFIICNSWWKLDTGNNSSKSNEISTYILGKGMQKIISPFGNL